MCKENKENLDDQKYLRKIKMNPRGCPSSLQIEVGTQVFTRHGQGLLVQKARVPQQNLSLLITKFSSISLFSSCEKCMLVSVPPTFFPVALAVSGLCTGKASPGETPGSPF